MFQKQSETTWLQLGLDNRNANNKIQCTRSTNSTANGTTKLWKCKTKHNSHKTIGNLKEHSWLWSSIFWYEELALDIGWMLVLPPGKCDRNVWLGSFVNGSMGPLCENKTPSTERKLHRNQRRTETQLQVPYITKFGKVWTWVFQIHKQTHEPRLASLNTLHTYQGQNTNTEIHITQTNSFFHLFFYRHADVT